jgi:ABC-2 type transport system ATP-binding protein
MTARPQPNAPARDDAIVVEDARKRFGNVTALDGISLNVPTGTILGLIGPSGSGKTTTVRLLTGAVTADKGKVRVMGEEPRRFRRQTRARIGYMPQQFTLYPDLTAAENVDFMASMFGLLWFRRRRRVREALRIVDLWDARKRRASALSGGMQRRLELACALVHDPHLYFLDEPTAGLDPILRGKVWEELHRLKDAGRTLLVTTQYVNEAEECDTVALIAHGRLVALATPGDLRREAVGGDLIEVETVAPFDGSVLQNLAEVRDVRPQGPRTFQVVVDEAGAATPAVVDAITQAGGEVAAAREFRPSFDDVFAELVERDARSREGTADTDEAKEKAKARAKGKALE